MEQTRFDAVTRLMGRLGTRRTALAVAATSGLAAGLDTVTGEAKKKNNVSDEKKVRGRRGKRGRRGRRGKRGKRGIPGGNGIVVVTEVCTLNGAGELAGATVECLASCGEDFVATGGGFLEPPFFEELGIVRGSFPATDDDTPIGWVARVEFINFSQEFEVTAYAVCAPV